jgi:plastocyanin
MSRTTRTRTWLVLLAAVAGTLAGGAGAVQAQESPGANKTIVVGDDGSYRLEHRAGPVVVNDTIKHVLHQNATKKHIYSYDGLGDYELDPANPTKRSFAITFNRVGKIYYRCKIDGLSGFVKVEPQAATTTSTTARPPTTTTTAPGAAATADPKFGAAAASTAQRGVAAVPSKAPTTTTSPIADAPSPASPAPGATVTPSPATGDQVSDIEAEVDAEEVAFQTAAADEADQGGTTMLILAIGFIVALLGGAGLWGWYHRSSRYQPA